MVTQPTLSDVLIEAGFETSIAHRAADVIERDLAGVAQQPDVDRRFDRIEVRLDVIEGRITAQDRLIEVRFEAVDKELALLNTRIDDLKENNEREFKAVHQRIDDLRAELLGRLTEHKESIERSLAAHKESLERRLTVQFWVIAFGFGAIIALLISILERLP